MDSPGGDIDVVLDSGAKFHITRAGMALSLNLHKAVLKAVEGVQGIDIMGADTTAILIRAATSEDVEALLLKCFERCTYNNLKVGAALFDDPRPEVSGPAREDYYQMAAEVWKVNCRPFVKRIPSWLKAEIEKARSASPASKSVSTTA